MSDSDEASVVVAGTEAAVEPGKQQQRLGDAVDLGVEEDDAVGPFVLDRLRRV